MILTYVKETKKLEDFCFVKFHLNIPNVLVKDIDCESYAISASVRLFTNFANFWLWAALLPPALRNALVLTQVTGYLCPTDMFCPANTVQIQYNMNTF